MLLEEITEGMAITLAAAAKLLPPTRGGKPVTQSCLLRWHFEGRRAPGGRRVKLEALKVGGQWLTSTCAMQRFIEAQNDSEQPAHIQTPTQRQRRAAAAGAELERIWSKEGTA
jgi:hypothetical protein